MYFISPNDFARTMYEQFNRNSEGQRIGQFAMNFFRRNFIVPIPIPDEVDCFYDDRLLGDFLSWIENNWNLQ